MTKPVAPCKDCRKREIGCHAKCKKYNKFSVDLAAWHAAVREETGTKEADSFLVSNYLERQKIFGGKK